MFICLCVCVCVCVCPSKNRYLIMMKSVSIERMLVVFLPIFPPKDKMCCVHLAEVGLSLLKSEDV